MSEFEVYKLCLTGIRKEAEQDNADFLHAMKEISRQELSEVIGRKVAPISREELIEQLRGKLQTREMGGEALSGMAALSAGSLSDDEFDIPLKENGDDPRKVSDNRPKKDYFRLITIIFIVVLLLSLILGLFL